MELSDEFKKSFINDFENMSVYDLRKKYDLSDKKYRRLKEKLGLGKKKQVRRETAFHFSYPYSKFYYKYDDRYIITRRIKGKSIHFCSCKSEETAKKTVELLKKYNWDKSKVPQIKKELDYEGENIRFKFKGFDFEGFEKDFYRLSFKDLLTKYDLNQNKYTQIKNYLKLGRKKHIFKGL